MSDDAGVMESGPRVPDPAAWAGSGGWRWARMLADHNPCFLLSAVLMFLGCYLLNSAMDVRAEEVGRALLLLLTINAYEFALIALGLALLRKGKGDARGRDGVLLLVVQMLFLADGAFLIAQLMQASGAWGWALAGAVLALGLAKAALVMVGAGIRMRMKTFGFLALQLLLIYGLPVVLWKVSVNGELAAGPMYVVWWIVGLLPALYQVLARWGGAEAEGSRQGFVRRAFVVAPWLLLVAHVGFYHYVYRADFVAADLSPVLLGLAVATLRIRPSRFVPAGQLRVLRMAMPAIALLLAMAGGEPATGGALAVAGVSPVLLTAGAMLVAYGYFVSWQGAACAVMAQMLAAIGWMFRDAIMAAMQWGFELVQTTVGYSSRIVPSSAGTWGIVAIVAAFVLLAAGGWWSLRGRTRVSQA